MSLANADLYLHVHINDVCIMIRAIAALEQDAAALRFRAAFTGSTYCTTFSINFDAHAIARAQLPDLSVYQRIYRSSAAPLITCHA